MSNNPSATTVSVDKLQHEKLKRWSDKRGMKIGAAVKACLDAGMKALATTKE